MKLKTAKRFLNRNAWDIMRELSLGNTKHPLVKKAMKCKMYIKRYNDIKERMITNKEKI